MNSFLRRLLDLIVAGTLMTLSWIGLTLLKWCYQTGLLKPRRTCRIEQEAIKIAFIQPHFMDDKPGKIGGRISHMIGFADGMIASGNKLFFISPRSIPGLDETRTPVYEIPPTRISRYYPFVDKIAYHYIYILRSCSILKKEKPDVLYQRHMGFTCLGAVLAVIFNLPLVLECNSPATLYHMGSKPKEGRITAVFANGLEQLFEEVAFQGADIVMVVSEAAKSILLNNLKVCSDKIRVNPNGVNPRVFSPSVEGEDIRRRYNLTGQIVIGFAGYFMKWHGIPVLLDAAHILLRQGIDIHILLIGDGDGDIKRNYEALAHLKGLDERFTITGIVHPRAVPQYLAACDVLVSPQIPMVDGLPYHQSPIKLFEYMAMGKPVVASDLGQIGKVIRDQENGLLVEPGDCAGLASAIAQLVTDKELAARLAANARNDVLSNYTWQHNAARVVSFVRPQETP